MSKNDDENIFVENLDKYYIHLGKYFFPNKFFEIIYKIDEGILLH